MWVLGTKHGLSEKATSIHNYSLAPSTMKELDLTTAVSLTGFQVKSKTIKGRGFTMAMLMTRVGGLQLCYT